MLHHEDIAEASDIACARSFSSVMLDSVYSVWISTRFIFTDPTVSLMRLVSLYPRTMRDMVTPSCTPQIRIHLPSIRSTPSNVRQQRRQPLYRDFIPTSPGFRTICNSCFIHLPISISRFDVSIIRIVAIIFLRAPVLSSTSAVRI